MQHPQTNPLRNTHGATHMYSNHRSHSRPLHPRNPARRHQQHIAIITRASNDEPTPSSSKGKRSEQQQGFNLEDINPYVMGRKSRALLDDVWTQFTKISSPVQSISLDDEFGRMQDVSVFEAPQAENTTVLVAGATGRVGRVLLRKLLLRGYKVRALVRPETAPTANIPQSVEVVVGDIGDEKACQLAVQGVDKVCVCWGA